MIQKILLGLGALFFILVGALVLIMGYVFNNPDSVFTAFHSVTDKILQGQKYEESEEFFLQGMDRVVVKSRHVDVVLHIHSGNTLKVHMQGKVPRFEQGPFIQQMAEQNELRVLLQEPVASSWIQMNVNGEEVSKESDVQLKADVYVPASFKGQLHIETREGNVQATLPRNAYEVDLQSVSGKISNGLISEDKKKPTSEIQPHEVGHIKIQTTQGSISVEPQP